MTYERSEALGPDIEKLIDRASEAVAFGAVIALREIIKSHEVSTILLLMDACSDFLKRIDKEPAMEVMRKYSDADMPDDELDVAFVKLLEAYDAQKVRGPIQ